VQAPRLVATDVDGTLLGHDELVGERTVAVIERLVAHGVGFVIVTGRPPRWIPPVAAQLPSARLAVCANGALLYDLVEDRIVWARTIAPAALAELVAAAVGALPECGIAVERASAGGSESVQFVADPGYRHAWPAGDGDVAERAELVTRPAVKMLIRCPSWTSEAMVDALAPVVGDLADITFSHPRGLLELSASGVTKATGLAAVAESLDVPAAAVVAFGDMPNDLEMLRWAGHGVAMGNAHPALLAAADEVTADNTDDGIALVLERWF